MATLFYKWCFLLSFPVFLAPGANNVFKNPSFEKKAHPLHISTVEIEHNPSEKTLEITCKTFWDDFENILGKINKTKVDLTNSKATSENNKRIFEYIKSNLKITINGKPVPLSFVGFEKEDVVIYSYLQADSIPIVKNLSITNSIMYDMFEDQVEIIHVIVNGNRKSTKLEYPAATAKFEFQ